MPRTLLPALLVLLLFLLCPLMPDQASAQQVEAGDSTTLVFMGDLVFDRIIGDLVNSQGVHYPFEPMMPYIQDADLLFANLETPISERGVEMKDKYCTFRSGPDTVNCLTYAGVDTVSLANNHCLDYGPDALNDTLMYLDRAGIASAGIYYDDPVENCSLPRPVVLEANGLRFGFLAYTENVREWIATDSSAGPMPLDEALMKRDIKYADGLVDYLVVSIHWRKWPQYTQGPEDGDRVLCRKVIDWGADLVMGHGPHTVHEVEGYGGGLILYSLGNAAMDCGNESSCYSYVARVRLKGTNITAITLVPTVKQAYRYVPYGTPLSRTAGGGFNVSYRQVWGMYENDVFNGTGEEEEGYEKNEWMIWRSGSPWYYKALSLLVFLVSVAVLIYIFYSVFKKGGKSILNLEEEFNGPRYQEQQPGTYPGGEQRPAQDPGGNEGPGDSGERIRGGGEGADSGSGEGKGAKGG